MALLSDPPAPPSSPSSPLRWLNPRRPEGMSVWGSAGVLAAAALLWVERGALREVWPNRCGLLQAQLTPEPVALTSGDEEPAGRWALPLAHPGGALPLWLPPAHYAPLALSHVEGDPRLALRALLSAEGVEAEGLLKRVGPEAARAALSGVAGRPWGRDADTLYLARLGLSLSARALTCDRELAEVEVEHMAALLLRGGLTAEERPRLRATRLVGAEGWWLSLAATPDHPAEERLWLPLASSPEGEGAEGEGAEGEGGRWAWEWRVRLPAPPPSAALPSWWSELPAQLSAAARAAGAL